MDEYTCHREGTTYCSDEYIRHTLKLVTVFTIIELA